ncbi:PTS transporter subunit EIIB, partial [Lactiplantibacillus plantarum]
MYFNDSAMSFIVNVGGEENINSLIHCSTRLCVSLLDFA